MESPLVALSQGEATRVASCRDWHDALLAKYSEFGFCYELEDIPVTPVLLRASFLEEMEEKLRRLMALGRAIAMQCFEGRSPIREDHRSIVELYMDAPRRPSMGRPDCILVGDTLKVLELNIDSGMGGIQEVDELVKGYRSSPLPELRPISIASPFEGQIRFIHEMLEEAGRKSVAIVPLADFSRLYLDQSDRLAEELGCQLGVVAKTVFPEALRKGAFLTDGQHDYGLFYRDACYLHEPIILAGMEQALVNARGTGTVVLGDPVDIGVDDKGALALISEHLDGPAGTDSAIADLGPLVPWTRLLDRPTTTVGGRDVDLAGYIRANRHRLVLKRCASHVGKQVYLGSCTDDEIWEDILARSKIMVPDGEDWVVQEFVPSAKLPLWFHTENGTSVLRPSAGTIGPFLLGETQAGWLVRIQSCRVAGDSVLALPTDGNMGVTTVAAVQMHPEDVR